MDTTARKTECEKCGTSARWYKTNAGRWVLRNHRKGVLLGVHTREECDREAQRRADRLAEYVAQSEQRDASEARRQAHVARLAEIKVRFAAGEITQEQAVAESMSSMEQL